MRQALKLLAQWSPMDVEDALELLSPTFTHPEVRRYSISRLKQAPDEDLILYLLQLVQALKYENFDDIMESYKRILPDKEIIKSLDDAGLDQSSASDSVTTASKYNSLEITFIPIDYVHVHRFMPTLNFYSGWQSGFISETYADGSFITHCRANHDKP